MPGTPNGWSDLPVVFEGTRLAAQVLGDGAAPTLILIPGATQSRDAWSDELCQAFVAAGLRIVRYDPRDTGQSTTSPVGQPDYSSADLADDVIAVLDAVGVDRALVAGLSMGGGVAQAVAATSPDRVAGIVLMSTSPADDEDRDLPGPTPAVLATFTEEAPDPDWADLEAVIFWMLEAERPYRGERFLEEDELRTSTEQTWRRSASMASASNHLAVAESGSAVDLTPAHGVPTLVVHGAADPLFPLPHGVALAELFDAELLVLDGVGHQVPPRSTWPDVVSAVQTLTAAARFA